MTEIDEHVSGTFRHNEPKPQDGEDECNTDGEGKREKGRGWVGVVSVTCRLDVKQRYSSCSTACSLTGDEHGVDFTHSRSVTLLK